MSADRRLKKTNIMKKEYIKPTMCVVKLMNGSSLLGASARRYDTLGDISFGKYDDGDDIIGEDDVI